MATASDDLFRQRFGADPEVRARAPGRVNLLGEHTDYSGGLVLPLAIDRWTEAAVARRTDGEIHIEAPAVGGQARLRADGLPQQQKERWLNYILGVIAELWPHADLKSGFDLAVSGNLPLGAGLGSSGALTTSVAYALSAVFDMKLRDIDLIFAAQRAEHRYVGVQCGLMDQAAAALALEGHVLLIDCRTLLMRNVPFAHAGIIVAVCHTGVHHQLVESEYNRRVAECGEALGLLKGLSCLGELSDADLLEAHRVLPQPLARRVDHVVLENERVRAGVSFLEVGDIESFGRLMYASHDSLRDRYEVSCMELDTLVASARAQGDAVMGAKMTGAGFGGAIVALVREERMKSFVDRMTADYRRSTRRDPIFHLCRSAAGARASLLTEAR